MSIIQIQHLYKTFGTGENAVHALEDISLDIQKGEIFGIIGLSGAGKSTLVRCMNLLERPTSGTVIVDGKDMTALSEKELRLARRNVTMIFQSFNLLMQRTVLKNVCFPMELSGTPAAQARKRALELLDLVGLREKADAYPSQLSGGQKQRVAIARALAMEPEVLGPAPAPVVKLNNRYRYRITVVGQNEKPLRQLLAAYMKAFARRPEHRNMAVHTDCNLMD